MKIQRTEIVYKDRKTGKNVIEVKESPKADSSRVIDIPKKAQLVFDRVRLMNPFGEYMFMNEYGRIRGKRFNYHLKKDCRELGIPERTAHKIRKIYGSNLLEKKVGEAIVQSQLGHR